MTSKDKQPAVTVGVPLKQIGTGLYEQPAPEHVNETPKTEHDAGNVLTPAPDAAATQGARMGSHTPRMTWGFVWAVLALCLALSLHKEVTDGYSVAGCYLRGLYGINDGVCDG